MGAAIALNFALRYPSRVLALILARPAWLDRPLPPNLELFPVIAGLIRSLGPERGAEEFERSEAHRELEQTYPASAESLRSQFREPRAAEAVIRLERIPRDCPCRDRVAWASIEVPTLVLANRADFIHPFGYGVELASAIPSATLCEVTPKAVSPRLHVSDIRAAIRDFVAGLREERE
jgi:pimeloyl-ACP methyl ester carboxylesterase